MRRLAAGQARDAPGRSSFESTAHNRPSSPEGHETDLGDTVRRHHRTDGDKVFKPTSVLQPKRGPIRSRQTTSRSRAWTGPDSTTHARFPRFSKLVSVLPAWCARGLAGAHGPWRARTAELHGLLTLVASPSSQRSRQNRRLRLRRVCPVNESRVTDRRTTPPSHLRVNPC